MRNNGLAYVSIGNIVSAVLSGLFWFYLATFMSTSSFGETSFYLALGGALSVVAVLGLNNTITTFIAKGESGIEYTANSVVLLTSIGVAMTLIPLNWQVSLIIVSTSLFDISIALLLGKQNYREFAVTLIGARVMQILLSLALFQYLDIFGVLIGYIGSNFVFGFRSIWSLTRFHLDFNMIRQKYKFISHSYSINLTNILPPLLDKVVILPLFGFTVLGLYQFGYYAFAFLSIIPTILYQYLLPEESSGKNKKNIYILGLGASIVLSLLIIFFSSYIIPLFFPKYIETITAVHVLSIAIIPATISSIFTSRMMAKEKTRHLVMAATGSIAVQLILIVYLGNIYGLVGLSLSLLIARITQAGYLFYQDRKLINTGGLISQT